MVFIEEQHKFIAGLDEQPKQKALLALLADQSLHIPDEDISDSDAVYYNSIQAIKENSKDEFNKQYASISKRKVSADTIAPFVHDDFLIFALIIGASKFGSKKDWLQDVIQCRTKNVTTSTFENLIKGDLQSKSNNHSLVLTFLYLLEKSKITDDMLIAAYEVISNVQEYNDDFIRINNYRAFNIIIKLKVPRDTDEISILIEFEKRFLKRVTVFSYLIYNIFLLLILSIITYLIIHYLPEDWKSNISLLDTILGIVGLGFLGNIIPKFKLRFREFTMKMFGYKTK